METRTVTVPNRAGAPQEFRIGIDEDSVTLLRAGRCPAQADIPAEIGGKPVTAIGEDCFFAQPILAVTIPDTVKVIGAQAFAMCKALQELILPDSVTEIAHRAFRDCTGLKRVILPANLKILRHGVFSFCYLTDPEIVLPEGLEVIEPGAFWSAGFFSLVIPASVREIGKGAFYFGPKPVTALPEDENWFRFDAE